MVERNVKLMSVQASPVVKKMVMVWPMALGCDQKKASIQPVRAPISQSVSTPTRMPICAADHRCANFIGFSGGAGAWGGHLG